jgi:hypothetical protein
MTQACVWHTDIDYMPDTQDLLSSNSQGRISLHPIEREMVNDTTYHKEWLLKLNFAKVSHLYTIHNKNLVMDQIQTKVIYVDIQIYFLLFRKYCNEGYNLGFNKGLLLYFPIFNHICMSRI